MRPETEQRISELARRAGIELPPRTLLAVAAVACAVIAFAAWRWLPLVDSGGAEMQTFAETTSTTAPASTPATASASAEPTCVVVHVVGAVRRPGVFRLPAGSRAEDAVSAAGGALGSAQLAALNLARVVGDGEQIVVPKRGETAVSANSAASAAGVSSGSTAGGKVNLNTASETELDALPGVGPATAKRIVEDRAANGPFRAPEDLMRVPGIGPKKYDAMKDMLSV